MRRSRRWCPSTSCRLISGSIIFIPSGAGTTPTLSAPNWAKTRSWTGRERCRWIRLRPTACSHSAASRSRRCFSMCEIDFSSTFPRGLIRADGKYQFAAGPPLELEVSDTLLHFTDIGIVEKGDSRPVMALHTLFLDGIHADLRERKLEIESLTLNKAQHRLWRNPMGRSMSRRCSCPSTSSRLMLNPPLTTGPPAAGRGPKWTVSLKEASITNHNIEFEDQSLDFPAKIKIKQPLGQNPRCGISLQRADSSDG